MTTPGEQAGVRRQRSGRYRDHFLVRQAARHGQQRNNHEKPPDQHGDAHRSIEIGRVCADPGEGAAVVSGAAGVGVQEFG